MARSICNANLTQGDAQSTAARLILWCITKDPSPRGGEISRPKCSRCSRARLISMRHAVSLCVGKEGTQNFHELSRENLWNSFDHVLWTTYDSAICRIEICGGSDSAKCRREPHKKNPGAKRLGKFSKGLGCYKHCPNRPNATEQVEHACVLPPCHDP